LLLNFIAAGTITTTTASAAAAAAQQKHCLGFLRGILDHFFL